MKLLFVFVFVLSRSAKSPSFNVRSQGLVSSPIASFVEQRFFMATFVILNSLNEEFRAEAVFFVQPSFDTCENGVSLN